MSIPFEVKRNFPVSKEEAYSSLVDLDAANHWMQGLVGIERMNEGPLREGSQWGKRGRCSAKRLRNILR
ncbi:hypothetical protein [Rossellomorea sp. DUT-2]|uniref:hypothetical protein n=1 Tax=Rossellomorea sp. DUT-2 TaxID=3412021 RepID=UPI003D186C5C